jgi:sugar/nucleoside kinase (ribokinase family)
MNISRPTRHTSEAGNKFVTGSEKNMRTDYDILLWGIYFCDLIFSDLPEEPRLGAEIFSSTFEMTTGGPFTTVVALHRLGLKVGWVCDFGNDSFSQFVLAAARQERIDTSLFQLHPFPVRRISAVFSQLNDRGFISFMDDLPQSSAIPFIEKHHPRCVFLPHLHYGKQYDALFAAARRRDTTVFMDCQSTDATLATPGVVEALQAVDIFAPNETEARQLTGATLVEDALAHLAEYTTLVIVKLGPGGAIARTNQQVVHIPAIEVTVADTTGAGDCFNAGFLYGYLRGATIEECLHLGNICGGLSTTAVGGRAAPTAAQVESYRSNKYLFKESN